MISMLLNLLLLIELYSKNYLSIYYYRKKITKPLSTSLRSIKKYKKMCLRGIVQKERLCHSQGRFQRGARRGASPPLAILGGGVPPPPVHPPAYWHQVIELFNTFWLSFKGGASNPLCYLTFFLSIERFLYNLQYTNYTFLEIKFTKILISILNSLWDPLIM